MFSVRQLLVPKNYKFLAFLKNLTIKYGRYLTVSNKKVIKVGKGKINIQFWFLLMLKTSSAEVRQQKSCREIQIAQPPRQV